MKLFRNHSYYLCAFFVLFACTEPIEIPSPPAFLAGPIALGVEANQVTLSWATDVPALGFVVLESETQVISLEVPDEKLAHDIVIQDLPPETNFSVRVIAQTNTLRTEGNLLFFETLRDPAARQFRILFDAAHGEDSGNADWVIDDETRFPNPAIPTKENDWGGAISNWGFDLFLTKRYLIETLPPGERLTFGDQTNPQDLAFYDALVLPEPNQPLSSQERSATISFVEQGGGLILIANHIGADRDNDGFDAIDVLNQLMNQNGHVVDVFGVQFDRENIVTDPAINLDQNQGTPVNDGPFGLVSVMGFNNGTTMTITQGGPAQAIGWDNGAPRDNTQVVTAVSRFGKGKVVLTVDSSPFDDGTARPGNDNIFNSWSASGQDNDIFFLNATAFVVGDDKGFFQE